MKHFSVIFTPEAEAQSIVLYDCIAQAAKADIAANTT